MRRIFLTGATGIMGMAGLHELMQTRYPDGAPQITVLARDTKTNRSKLASFISRGVEVIWGDLTNPSDVERGVKDADVVLHVGGMVSPQADWYPELTYKVNVGSMRNIISAALRRQSAGHAVRVVYIGSVSQYGNRPEGVHWGRTGDPISIAAFDNYALSKSDAERMLAESGLKEWVSLRQTGILYPRILLKGSDPISFHVPVRGCLEWVTNEDSGRLLAAVSSPDVPSDFWCRFYNIGGGESYRLTNYDFVQLTLQSVGCPPASKVFGRNWFATRNFHGMWFEDSDLLDSILRFRSGEKLPEFMDRIKRGLPWYFRLAPLAPAWIIRKAMKRVANNRVLGPLRWIAEDNKDRVFAAFGTEEDYRSIPTWEDDAEWSLSSEPSRLDHGYDENKPESELTLADMQEAARYRGGRCLADDMKTGDIDTPLGWECSEGHRFTLRPRTVLKGGHWCPECLAAISRDPHELYRLGKRNPFLGQITGK